MPLLLNLLVLECKRALKYASMLIVNRNGLATIIEKHMEEEPKKGCFG